MIDTSKISWPISSTYLFCPDLPYPWLVKLWNRWSTWQVKYSAASVGLGIYDGGYINCPSMVDMEERRRAYWESLGPIVDKLPYFEWTPYLVNPLANAWLFGGLTITHLATVDEDVSAWDDRDWFWAQEHAYGIWICLLVGCNTMFLEVSRQSSRGRPRKH